jgi:hypothetical protein
MINTFIISQSSVQFPVCHLQFKPPVQPYSTNYCSGLFTYSSVNGNRLKETKMFGAGIAQAVQQLVHLLDKESGLHFLAGQNFLFSTVSRLALGYTQPSTHIPRTFSPKV